MKKTPDWLIKREIMLDGRSVRLQYDTEGDILEIFFHKGGGVGVELTDNIVLRFDKKTEQAMSLMLHSYSRLIQPTKFGPSSFQLSALSELPGDMQHTVLNIIQSFPVNHFLKLSGLFGTTSGATAADYLFGTDCESTT